METRVGMGRWDAGGRGEPARPVLRLVRGGGAPAASARDDGHPAIVGRLQGWPLVVRVWALRPEGVLSPVRGLDRRRGALICTYARNPSDPAGKFIRIPHKHLCSRGAGPAAHPLPHFLQSWGIVLVEGESIARVNRGPGRTDEPCRRS